MRGAGRGLPWRMTPPDPDAPGALSSTRIDKWLWAARCYKTRSQATEACAAGKVRRNGAPAKAADKVKAGDRVEAECPGERTRILEVRAIGEVRGSAEAAALLFIDHTPPPPPKEVVPPGPSVFVHRGEGRPSKRDRRSLERVKGW